ncbi:MAG TPA: hypothetical protein VH082_06745, partial [Rudaea sp.]|nr:hypothetical protein [Rudaea sp.]
MNQGLSPQAARDFLIGSSSFPRKRESSDFAFGVFLEQKLPPQAAGNFLLNGKKSPKNVFDCSRSLLSADSTSVLLAADRA